MIALIGKGRGGRLLATKRGSILATRCHTMAGGVGRGEARGGGKDSFHWETERTINGGSKNDASRLEYNQPSDRLLQQQRTQGFPQIR